MTLRSYFSEEECRAVGFSEPMVQTLKKIADFVQTQLTVEQQQEFIGPLQDLTTTGFLARLGTDLWATRTLTGTASQIAVTDGDGVAANPVASLVNTAVTPASYGDATHVAQFTVDQQGRLTAAANVAITSDVQALLDGISSTQGSVLYRNASAWVALGPGTSGQFLKTQGAAANPVWASAISGSGAWSLITTSTTTGVTHVDFTGLSGYSDILLIGIGVTGSASSFRGVQLSTNNGSTFFGSSGDYIRPTTSGVSTNQTQFDMVDASSSGALSFAGLIQGINVNGAPKRCSSSSQLECIFKGSLSPVDAITYRHSSAGNISGGTLYLLGR